MKTNIKQQLEAAILDNQEYIKAYGGNIRAYFEKDYGDQDQGHCWYLTDEEIEAWENDENERSRLNNEILDILYQYDIHIDVYLNKDVKSAY